MYKCGQKDNKNYTFGIVQEQLAVAYSQTKEVEDIKKCAYCHGRLSKNANFCPSCGEKCK